MNFPLVKILLTLLIAIAPLAAKMAPLRVVTSFSIPADWTAQIGGENVEVSFLVPPNSDIHAYQPTPADLRKISQADVIIAISPTLETWFAKLISSENLRKKTIFLGERWLPNDTAGHPGAHHSHAHSEDDDDDDEEEHAHSHSPENDPHLWLDTKIVAEMTRLIADFLAKNDTAHAKKFSENADAYAKKLAELDTWAEKTLAQIPAERRVLISNHDNLRRFAKRHNFQVAGAIFDSTNPETSDTSAGKFSALIAQAKKFKTPVFYDNTLNKKLAETVTREAKLPPPVPLFIDALDTPQSPAGTYLGMYRENVRRIAEALK